MANFNLFQKTPVKVPNKSGFDLSHENMLTLMCGTLVPVMTDLLIPGDKVSVGSAFEIQLPPMQRISTVVSASRWKRFLCRVVFSMVVGKNS